MVILLFCCWHILQTLYALEIYIRILHLAFYLMHFVFTFHCSKKKCLLNYVYSISFNLLRYIDSCDEVNLPFVMEISRSECICKDTSVLLNNMTILLI